MVFLPVWISIGIGILVFVVAMVILIVKELKSNARN
jgi:hypothetical protein